MVGETGAPGGNPRKNGANMQTPPQKDLRRLSFHCLQKYEFSLKRTSPAFGGILLYICSTFILG